MAVYTLPDTPKFCSDLAPGLPQTELEEKLIKAGQIMDDIFSKTDKLFIDHELDTIP